MFVIPKAGSSIVDPARQSDPLGKVLPPEGRDVGDADSHYWIRRQQDGDVKIVPENEVDAAKANAVKAQQKRDQEAAEKRAADEKNAQPKPAEPAKK